MDHFSVAEQTGKSKDSSVEEGSMVDKGDTEVTVESKKCNTCGRVYVSATDFLRGTSRWRLCAEENLWFNCACGSTLFLRKGKYSWYSPTHGLSSKAATVFNQLSNKNALPYMKSTVLRLQELLARPEDVEISQVVATLRGDPLLVSEVIQMAGKLRSSRGGVSEPMDSLQHAVAYVGLKAIADIVMIASLKTLDVRTKSFDIERFWQESFTTAVIAESLCKKFSPSLKVEDAYIAGFLCNIGKVISAYYFPDELDRIVDAMKNPKNKGTWLEHEKNSDDLVDHTVLGEIACAFWGLSPVVLDAVMKHHNGNFERAATFSIHELIALANQLGHWARLEPGKIDTKLLENLGRRFKLDDTAMEALAENLGEIIRRVTP